MSGLLEGYTIETCSGKPQETCSSALELSIGVPNRGVVENEPPLELRFENETQIAPARVSTRDSMSVLWATQTTRESIISVPLEEMIPLPVSPRVVLPEPRRRGSRSILNRLRTQLPLEIACEKPCVSVSVRHTVDLTMSKTATLFCFCSTRSADRLLAIQRRCFKNSSNSRGVPFQSTIDYLTTYI